MRIIGKQNRRRQIKFLLNDWILLKMDEQNLYSLMIDSNLKMKNLLSARRGTKKQIVLLNEYTWTTINLCLYVGLWVRERGALQCLFKLWKTHKPNCLSKFYLVNLIKKSTLDVAALKHQALLSPVETRERLRQCLCHPDGTWVHTLTTTSQDISLPQCNGKHFYFV